ncbi:homoserine O-acetyltransferase [Salpingoeca rosetta]|uniref:Homoserine O-acetyltransferase n=1 Tax=Salpingoeca rosetta (strain ATCC 50818 / BSB-021) TaxID=946362 RepID=F2U0E0_SALR5|nr:homoserine O-acetyltransferase [Salpingoeca rosetta]EGD80868.1 homoserine O-acetyltransferase [Salpingoeca rosetta]|eukprot:XP_004997429.1 homoserine O-acetyltransferase [Salpingoeca rosetta]
MLAGLLQRRTGLSVARSFRSVFAHEHHQQRRHKHHRKGQPHQQQPPQPSQQRRGLEAGSASPAAHPFFSEASQWKNPEGEVTCVQYPANHYTYYVEPSEYAPSLQEESSTNSAILSDVHIPEPSYVTINYGYNVFHSREPFQCEIKDNPNGGVLPELHLAYETWGTLSPEKDNVVFLHTGLSASSHAHSHERNKTPGWWEKFIGPGKAIDTNKYFVICSNNLGGCYGTSGPSSINPSTNKEYATSFPLITVQDMIRAQFLLLDHLGIDKLHASVGSSLGGMQSLAAAAMYPERVGLCVSISAAHRAHPTAIALRYMQRRIIMADPHWAGGNYYGKKFPVLGMKHAREIATISYRSGPEWEKRFSRQRIDGARHSFMPEYLIETYLDHQGTTACLRYDPNSLIYISKAMDMFDMTDGFEDPTSAIARITCPTLVIGVQSDLLFPVMQQREVVQLLREGGNENVTYYELDALYGHDTFLIDVNTVGAAVKGHLEHCCL